MSHPIFKELKNKLYYPNFNHKVTLLGGQSFSWDIVNIDENMYLGWTDKYVVVIRVVGDYIYWQTYPSLNSESVISRYFRVGVDSVHIENIIGKDEHVKLAITKFSGIKILKQPLNLTILSFIISANNNIKAIRRSVRILSNMFGDVVEVPVLGKITLFPTVEALAKASIDDIRKAKVGFRAKYLKETSEILLYSGLSERFDVMNQEEQLKALLQLPGVGNKIADCVMVFAGDAMDITPMDVWGKRILKDLYGIPDTWKYEQYREWIRKQWGGFGAYAGQYLFEWYRNKSRS